MLSLSPPLCPNQTSGWVLEGSILWEEQNLHNLTQKTEPSYEQQCITQHLVASESSGSKRHVHNASERRRRMRINALFSSLRALLPGTDQTKKLTIPTTISRVLHYIPELQREVTGLIQHKEKLLIKINTKKEDLFHDDQKQRKLAHEKSSFVSTIQVGNGEIVIQIYTVNFSKHVLSVLLHNLEHEDGLFLLNASSFQSFGGRVLHSLHFQVQGAERLELATLRERLEMLTGTLQ